MKLGIPRERKANEKRVALTPESARILSLEKWDIYLEKDAGIGSGFRDDEYKAHGVTILPTLEKVWEVADILLKVKEPAPEEYPLMRDGQIVFSFLHPAADRTLTEAMLKARIIGLDYDLVETDDKRLPILEPMSMIAGTLAVHCGSEAMLSQHGGPGLLLETFLDTPPSRVLVIGAGVSGTEAIKKASALSADICVLDINQTKLDSLTAAFPNIETKISNQETIKEELTKADLVIGAVLIPGARAPRLITKDMLSLCKEGAVLVDISIDQGGISETSRPTTLSDPSYIIDHVIHYCVSNMPAMVPRTASIALSKRTLPYLQTLGKKTLGEILRTDNEISRSLVCYKGKLTNQKIADAFGLPYEK
jgi:alanine dehydrogenase